MQTLCWKSGIKSVQVPCPPSFAKERHTSALPVMVTRGDLLGGEVDTAEEVRAMMDKSMSIDKEKISCCMAYIPQ